MFKADNICIMMSRGTLTDGATVGEGLIVFWERFPSSEYRSLASVTAEVVWLKFIFTELGIVLETPPTWFWDNYGAMKIASNPVQHARTKHIEVDQHFVREKVQSQEVIIDYVPSDSQVADMNRFIVEWRLLGCSHLPLLHRTHFTQPDWRDIDLPVQSKAAKTNQEGNKSALAYSWLETSSFKRRRRTANVGRSAAQNNK